MSLALAASTLAVGPNLPIYFSAQGGTAPYVFSMVNGGVGGTIDPASGLYISGPSTGSDTIMVTDNVGAISSLTIMVGNALELFCDIIQNQMGLANGRVYLWDQKVNSPTDSNLFIVVGELSCKPFGSSIKYIPDNSGDLNAAQAVNMFSQVSVDIQSRGPDARDRKEEVILALKSTYSQTQQALNSFYISPISSGFVNLSDPDGDAIPYRFNITVNIQYMITKTNAVPFFNTFQFGSVVTNQ